MENTNLLYKLLFGKNQNYLTETMKNWKSSKLKKGEQYIDFLENYGED